MQITPVKHESSGFANSKEYEQKLLGRILWQPEQLTRARGIIKPSDFRHEKNQVIYEAMLALHKKIIEIDVLGLWEQLRESGDLERAGGSAYLTYLPLIAMEGESYEV